MTTAMQKLLLQLREERVKLPMPIEWNRCYQSIENLIESTYIPLEKEQILDAYSSGADDEFNLDWNPLDKREDIDCEKYYEKKFEQK